MAYVFERSGGTWGNPSGNGFSEETQLLRASNANNDDQFGASVAISGNRAVVGASNEAGPSNGKTRAGATYVFERTSSGWNQNEDKILRTSNAEGGDQFGFSVAIEKNRAIVGAFRENGSSNGKTDAGATYVFGRTSSDWSQNEDKILRASKAEADDQFGFSVAIEGNRAIVGARGEDGASNNKTNAGAAYVKSLVAPTFTSGQSASLKVREDGSADLVSTLEVADLSSSDNLKWSVESAPSGSLSGVDEESESVSGSDSPHTLSTSPTYTPGAGFDGSDSFTIQVSDGSATDEITVDVTVQEAPGIASITQTGSDPTNVGSVDFEVTFSEPVSGVGTGDFTAVQTSGSASGSVSSVSGSGSSYTVTVGSITGTGDLRLDVDDNDSITNGDGVPLGGVGTGGAGDGSTGGTPLTIDNTDPTADAGSDMTVASGTEVAFDGTGATDNGSIASYKWEFGDGTTATGKAPTHTYSNSGTYTATLTVTDEAGNTDTDAVTITVDNAPSISSLSDRTVRAGQTLGPVGITVSDPETAAAQLTLSASSSNATLVPESGLTVTGPDVSGTARLEVAPASGESGTATVTVTVEDEEGQTVSSSFALNVVPGTVSASVSRSFGDASGPWDYRLVALPGQVSRPLGQAVSGKAGQEWQAYRDDGSSSGFLVEYDGSDDFTFESGNGFWLTSTERWTSSLEASAVDLQDGTAEIALRDGWNVISNPLGTDVSWSAVEKQNVDTQDGEFLQPLWGFDGSFGKASTFASATSGKAYYFFNDQGLSTLQIPYPSSSKSASDPKAKAQTGTPAEADSMLALTARLGTAASTVRIGFGDRNSKTAAVAAPPARFSAVSLRIEARQSTSEKAPGRTDLLMADSRAVEGRGTTVPLQLRSRAEGPVTLSAEHLEATGREAVALVNPSSGTSHDLRSKEAVQVRPSGKQALRLAVGTEQYVTQQKRAARPTEVTLTAYPNPVREQGTLEYTLPEAGTVSLRVYDVLGRRVATLASGRTEAGLHTATLPASRLSSGVYIARLRVGGTTVTQKITVVR